MNQINILHQWFDQNSLKVKDIFKSVICIHSYLTIQISDIELILKKIKTIIILFKESTKSHSISSNQLVNKLNMEQFHSSLLKAHNMSGLLPVMFRINLTVLLFFGFLFSTHILLGY